MVFNQTFVSDIETWKTIPHEKINKVSTNLLKEHKKKLKPVEAESVTELLE